MPSVVYVLAHSRSGSTLLARMLGQVAGWVSVGEVRYLFRRGMVENQPCGCGQRFAECEFWSAVVREAYGQVSASEALRMSEAVRAADRIWRMGRLGAITALGPGARARRRDALAVLAPLYAAMERVSGASVIVDSSKSPSFGALLSDVPGIRLRLVHLVRDCRGVAYSRLRRLARGEIRAASEDLLVARTALEWDAVNSLARRLQTTLPYTLVSYEDLVARPRPTLQAIVDPGGGGLDLPFLRDGTVLLGGDHTVSGNQMRFASGWTPLRPDDEWQGKLTAGQGRILRLLSGRDMARYGYR
jgi:sulfotransferase family protein